MPPMIPRARLYLCELRETRSGQRLVIRCRRKDDTVAWVEKRPVGVVLRDVVEATSKLEAAQGVAMLYKQVVGVPLSLHARRRLA